MGEEGVQEVPGGLGVDLLFAQVDLHHFGGLGRQQAQHLLGMEAAFKDVREDFASPGHQLVPCGEKGERSLQKAFRSPYV